MPYKKHDEAVDTAGKTESFWTRNVRLLTFLICTAAFLVVFIPLALWGYTSIPEMLRSCAAGADTRPEMTVEDLSAVANKNRYLSMTDLDAFAGEKSRTEQTGVGCTVYQITIEKRYLLMAIFDETSKTVFHLTLTDLKSNDVLDLLEDYRNLDTFLKDREAAK